MGLGSRVYEKELTRNKILVELRPVFDHRLQKSYELLTGKSHISTPSTKPQEMPNIIEPGEHP
jgi:hypothetical protein